MAFYIKQNDTAPAIRATLNDTDANVTDLTDATVRFHMRRVGATTITTDGAAIIVGNAANGIVQYDWESADTAKVNTYQAEFEVTYSDGSIETFPNSSYITVEVTDDLA